MSVLSENNVQSATNCAFSLKARENFEKEKRKIANTYSSIMLLYCTNYPSIELYWDTPSSIISLKLVK